MKEQFGQGDISGGMLGMSSNDFSFSYSQTEQSNLAIHLRNSVSPLWGIRLRNSMLEQTSLWWIFPSRILNGPVCMMGSYPLAPLLLRIETAREYFPALVPPPQVLTRPNSSLLLSCIIHCRPGNKVSQAGAAPRATKSHTSSSETNTYAPRPAKHLSTPVQAPAMPQGPVHILALGCAIPTPFYHRNLCATGVNHMHSHFKGQRAMGFECLRRPALPHGDPKETRRSITDNRSDNELASDVIL